ncbi:MAG: FAD-dependent oxidoreductase [Phycisphaerales bacterium]
MRHFDLCVIGSGPGGQKCAIQAAKLGKRVCVVEAKEVVGGAAVNTGTIPSKALREAVLSLGGTPELAPRSAEFIKVARNSTLANLWGVCGRVIRAEIDMVQGHLSSNGIEVLHGLGRFKNKHEVEVVGQHACEVIHAEHVAIAVGTHPSRPPNIDFDHVDILTSDELLGLKSLPYSMIVVGGGVIGTEYASMLATLGVKVTLIEGRPRLLDFVDSEIIEALQYHLRQAGVTMRLGEKVVSIKKVEAPPGAKSDNAMMVEAMLESGKVLRADCLLYSVGRQGRPPG